MATGESGPKPVAQTVDAPRYPAPLGDDGRNARSGEAEPFPPTRRRAPAPGRAADRERTPRPVEPTRHLRQPQPQDEPANDRGLDRAPDSDERPRADGNANRPAARDSDRDVGQARTIEFPSRTEDPLGERTQATRRGPRHASTSDARPSRDDATAEPAPPCSTMTAHA